MIILKTSTQVREQQYSWLSLSRPRLSRITAYLEVKVWSLLKNENLITSNKILWKRGEIAPKEQFLLFHNIFNICLTSRVQLHIHLLNAVVRFIFSSSLQIWYVEVRISRSILESPLEFEIMRADCILSLSSVYISIQKAWPMPIGACEINGLPKASIAELLVTKQDPNLCDRVG